MKGYFYKERVRNLLAAVIILAVYILWAVLAVVFKDDLSIPSVISLMFVLTVVLYTSRAEDKKNLWEFSSRALPVSPAKRIGARFLATVGYIVSVFVLLRLISGVIYAVNFNLQEAIEQEPFLELLKNYFNVDYITYRLIELGMFIFAAGVSITICMFSKNQAGLTLSYLPYILAFIILSFIILSFLPLSVVLSQNEDVVNVFSSFSFALRSLAYSILIYIGCYCLCVARETIVDRKKYKSAVAAAVVLLGCGVLLFGSCVYSLEKSGVFYNLLSEDEEEMLFQEPSKQEEYEKSKQEIDNELRPVMFSIADDVCGELLLEKPTEQLVKFFEERGYGEYLDGVNDDYNLVISHSTYYNSTDRPDYPDVVSVYAQILDGTISAENYEEKLTEVKNNFALGVTEEHAIEMMRAYNLCPEAIIDSIDGTRYSRLYRINFKIYNETDETTFFHSLSLEFTDGKVYKAIIY